MSNRLAYTLSAGAAALVLLALLKPSSKSATTHRSPIHTVFPGLSQPQIDDLAYPPDALPGGRDIETPYGTIKVFEWGPESGRKVLLVHGISTPCVALGATANELVQRGCRVMLFDLFGRGYSDTPTDIKHDIRLYTSQILLVLASSPLSWTGDAAFDLVGYSFGGGISATFTRYFPRLVRSVILLAPGGIIRNKHVGWQSKILYSKGVLPERLLMYLVLRRLRPAVKPEHAGTGAGAKPADGDGKVEPSHAGNIAEAAVAAEVGRGPTDIPDLAVGWQIEHHKGFVAAFMSSIRNGPIHDQHPDWALLGQVMAQRRADSSVGHGPGLVYKDQVLLVIGEQDPIVLKEEVPQDARDVLGEANVKVEIIDGAHDFPIKQSGKLVDVIWGFWGDQPWK